MKEEVIYEEGRETDELSSVCKKFFDAINKYNDEHEDQANVVVLACDSKGGASFCIGETDKHVTELFESAAKHEVFRDFIKGILEELNKS